MKKVCVIGHFGFGETLLNGQTVKTKILTSELERRFGESEVMKIDTRGGVKALLKLPFKTFSALKNCKNAVILPAHNGLRVITPVLRFWNFFFRRGLHYAVIGGWLASFLEKRKCLARMLRRFDGIYVETDTMRRALEAQGFQNITVMPNCKELRILAPEELVYPDGEPYRLCTFSRVMRLKGIEDAVNAVRAVNEAKGRTVYQLDIYGQVDAGETEWFEELQKSFPPYIRYGGMIPFQESVDAIKSCTALLFPTHYMGEGFPGTVIDAYAAGVPVIAAKWMSFADLIEEGVTGIGYTFGESDELTDCLKALSEDPTRLSAMKRACIARAEAYLPEAVISILADRLA